MADTSSYKIQTHVVSHTVKQMEQARTYRVDISLASFSEDPKILSDLVEYFKDRWVFPYGDLAEDVRIAMEKKIEDKDREINRLKMELDRLRREGDESRKFLEELGKGLEAGRIGP